MTPSGQVRETGERIEALIEELGERAEELVRLLVGTYGEGLARIATLAGPEVIDRLASDPLVASLLVLHGLHPLDAATRARQALDRLRPFGQIQILELSGTSARLRVEAAAAPGLRAAIERVLEEAAPEVTEIEIEGLAEAAVPLVQIALGGTPEGAR